MAWPWNRILSGGCDIRRWKVGLKKYHRDGEEGSLLPPFQEFGPYPFGNQKQKGVVICIFRAAVGAVRWTGEGSNRAKRPARAVTMVPGSRGVGPGLPAHCLAQRRARGRNSTSTVQRVGFLIDISTHPLQSHISQSPGGTNPQQDLHSLLMFR